MSLLGERIYVSQYRTNTVGIVVHVAGVPEDADGAVNVTYETTANPPVAIFIRPADNVDTGVYEVTLSSVETSVPAIYRLRWDYEVGTVPQTYSHIIEVGEANAAYDSLDEGMAGIVEGVWNRFADMFDSPYGGPHLQVHFQTRFGRGRLAQLLGVALGRLNTIAQPHQTYSLDPDDGAPFPVGQWGALLGQSLYIETLKHLIRSYVEQPNDPGVTVARLDRRDYMNRWESVLRAEEADLKAQLDVFKIAHMGLGRGRVLVSGGAYGNYGPITQMSRAGRPRYPLLFH